MRLARRDAWRSPGRSLLVVLLIALPVAAVTSIDLDLRATADARSTTANALSQLGSAADALVTSERGGAVAQGYTGGPMTTVSETGAPPSEQQLSAALPSGSRLALTGQLAATAIERGDWGLAESLRAQDVTDPLLAGLWRVRDGALPSTTNEIALTSDAADRLHASIGDQITLTPLGSDAEARKVTLVGITTSPAVGGAGVVLPGAMVIPAPTGSTSPSPDYLVDAPAPMTWADVRRLNAIGAFVISRSVIEDPPSFCPLNVLCGDNGPLPGATADPFSAQSSNDVAQAAALGAVVTVLVILQVALLAGPAFAVSLRRRQRELGLLGASGADNAALRRTMLASGVVLGFVGACVGLVLGWIVTWVLSATQNLDLGVEGSGPPALRPELLAVAGIGVLAAVAAALVPAVSAGRGDVVDSLRGRKPPAPITRRTPVTGLVLGVVGMAGMLYGARSLDPVVLCVSILTAELGLILVMPALVMAFGSIGRWLPLAPRLAVRDAGRHRMRTTAAACAIAAVAAGSIAVAAWAQSSALVQSSSDVVWVDGTVLTLVSDQVADDGTPTRPSREMSTSAAAVARAALPGAAVTRVTELVPISAKDPWGGDWTCVMPGEHPADGSTDVSCQGRGTEQGWFTTGMVVIDDPAQVRTLLGPLGPNDAAIAALDEGKALVLTPGTTDASGQLALREQRYDDQGNPLAGKLVTVPALGVASGAIPVNVIIAPAALKPGMPMHGLVREQTTTLLVTPVQADTADRPTASDVLTLAYAKNGLGGLSAQTVHTTEDSTTLVLAMAVGATVLLSLLAGLMVTALAVSDGRADLSTLAAVGAEPAIRRRIASSSAGFIATVGCTVGAVSGLVAARLLVPLFTREQGSVFVTPWLVLLLTVVGIPVFTAGVAWIFTRPTVVMVRRSD